MTPFVLSSPKDVMASRMLDYYRRTLNQHGTTDGPMAVMVGEPG